MLKKNMVLQHKKLHENKKYIYKNTAAWVVVWVQRQKC